MTSYEDTFYKIIRRTFQYLKKILELLNITGPDRALSNTNIHI